jgi:hypothetical protein
VNAEWWSAIGIVIATLILIVIPGVIYAYYVLDLWIADTTSYATVMREVEPREEQSRPAPAAAPRITPSAAQRAR